MFILNLLLIEFLFYIFIKSSFSLIILAYLDIKYSIYIKRSSLIRLIFIIRVI